MDKNLLTVDFKLMKVQNYLEESLNFSDALKKLQKKSDITAQSSPSIKQVSRLQFSQKYLKHNGLSGAKITKRSNVTLKQLLQEYSQDRSNFYILKLSGFEGRCQSVNNFDDWILQMGKKNKQCSNNQRNENTLFQAKKESQTKKVQPKITCKQQSTTFVKQKYNQLSVRLITEQNNVFASSERFRRSDLIESPKLSFGCRNTKNMISFKTQFGSDEDEVIQQTQKPQAQAISTKMQSESLKSQKKQIDKQNIDPNNLKPIQQIKGLQFSTNKRYRVSKRKKKAQV